MYVTPFSRFYKNSTTLGTHPLSKPQKIYAKVDIDPKFELNFTLTLNFLLLAFSISRKGNYKYRFLRDIYTSRYLIKG